MFALLLSAPLQAGELTILSFNSRLLHPLLADITEVKIDYIILNENRLNASIGANFPIMDWKIDTGDSEAQFGFLGVTFNRLYNKGNFAFNLDTNDSKFGFYFDYRKSSLTWNISYIHYSTHLNEGIFLYTDKFNEISAVRYSREYLQLLGSWQIRNLRIYAGLQIPTSVSSPDNLEKRFLLDGQMGIELNLPPFWQIHPVLSMDLKSLSELEYYISRSFSLGFFGRGESGRMLGLQFFYYRGYDPRGNFFDKMTCFWGGGVSMYF